MRPSINPHMRHRASGSSLAIHLADHLVIHGLAGTRAVLVRHARFLGFCGFLNGLKIGFSINWLAGMSLPVFYWNPSGPTDDISLSLLIHYSVK